MKRTILPVILVSVLLFPMQGCDTDKKEYVKLAQATYDKILKGDQSAAEAISWNEIQVNGEEVGRGYMQLREESEKRQFQKYKLSQWSQQYRAKAWTPERMLNWRVELQGVESGIVAADAPGGKLVVNIQKKGGRKFVIRMEIK